MQVRIQRSYTDFQTFVLTCQARNDSTVHCSLNTDELDKFCPVKTTRIKRYIPGWIDDNLINQIRDRDYFYAKAIKTKNEDDWNIAKHLRNVVNSNIRQAKANFVIKNLNDNAKDSSKFWRQIIEVFPGSKQKSKRTKIHLVDNATSTLISESDTADYINIFFINVGNPPNLESGQRNTTAEAFHLPRVPRIITNAVGHVITPSRNPTAQANQVEPIEAQANMHLTENMVLDIVKLIETNKSSGLTHFKNSVLKSSFKVLIPQLTYIFNLSTATNLFPTSWKKALVVPIPKTGNMSSVSNYRPISLLPQPGKN